MDNTAQNAQNTSQVSQGVSDQTQVPSQEELAGSNLKEHAPVVLQEESFSNKVEENSLKPSEIEPQLHEEVKEAGVEVSKEHHAPEVPPDSIKIGVQLSTPPISTSSSQAVKLPMTEKEALHIIKTTSVRSSRHWFALLIEKIYQQLGLKNKG